MKRLSICYWAIILLISCSAYISKDFDSNFESNKDGEVTSLTVEIDVGQNSANTKSVIEIDELQVV